MLGRRSVKSKLLPLGSSLYATVRSIGEALRARCQPPEEVAIRYGLASHAIKGVDRTRITAGSLCPRIPTGKARIRESLTMPRWQSPQHLRLLRAKCDERAKLDGMWPGRPTL
jgi:hypothetical protein